NHGALESPRKVIVLSVSRGNVSLISFGLRTFSYGFSNRDRWSATRFQFGAIKIGASVRFCFNVWKALMQSSEKMNGISFSRSSVGNKMHKAFPLLFRKFPLPEGTSYCLKMNATVRRIEMPLPEVCTAIEEKKKKLPFMDVEVEKDDLNQKFLTSLAPEWLMHTIVWRNGNDLDTISLDDLYNHLKVYEAEVQKKSNPNSQNMAFISSSKHSSGDEDGNTACVSTSSTTFPTASASVATISQDTASTYIAFQSNGSHIKFEDINQIDEDDMEEMDIKWSTTLLSMRADKFWKKTGKKISIQGSDVAGFDKSKVECFNCHKMGHFSYMENKGEDHALVADAEAPTEFALMVNTKNKVFDNSLCSNDCKKNNDSLNSLLKASKNLDNLTESQRSDKVKDGVGYNAVPPPAADLYLSPKKVLSLTGLPEFVDDTVTDYSRPSPTVASTSAEGQNKNSTTSEDVASPNTPKPFVKFVKPKDSQSESKINKKETAKKPQVEYAEQYKHSNKKPNVKGNQRNWNNLKSYQLGPEFVLKKKACFNCGDLSHFANECRKKVKRETTRSQNHVYMCPSHRAPWVPTINRNNFPVNRKFSTGRRNFPTVNRKFPTASRKFTTGSTKIRTADMGRKEKAIKPSACWIWKPTQNLSNKAPNNNSVSVMFKKYTYIDTQGRLKSVIACDDV
nr:hypothetical protein [Tanacetum cinerariifolium]